MKTKQLIALTAIFGTGLLWSCSDSTENKMENSADSLAAKMENGIDNLGNRVDSALNKNADEDFLSDAVEANTLELRALMIGKERGSKEVKSHATHMIADHKKLGNDVMDYVKKKNVNLTDVDTNETSDDLRDKAAGTEFDKAFADKMVSDHEKVIDLFEDAQDDVQDPELKTMITNALPKLKSHLDMSKKMQEKMK